MKKGVLFLLFALATIICQGQYFNAKGYRLIYRTDSTGISGVGEIRWDQVTGKFRFWNGTSWISFMESTASTGIGGTTGSTDEAILRADGTGGSTMQGSTVTLSNSGIFTGSLGFSGTASFPATVETAATNSIVPIFSLRRNTSGTAAIGIGASIQFAAENSSGSLITGGEIASVATGVTASSESFDLAFKVKPSSNGALEEKFRIASTGAIGIAGTNYGSSGQVLTSGGSSASPSWQSVVATSSGVYTPTFSSGTNLDATPNATASTAKYIRVGDIVTVTLYCNVNPTAAGAYTFSITLPVASNFTTASQLLGVGGDSALDVVEIVSEPTGDVASVTGTTSEVNNHSIYMTFTYSVL